jgi:hypothetical protein
MSVSTLLVGFAAGLVVAAAVVFLARRADWFSGGPRFDTSRPAVVRQVRQLQRLETIVYTMDKIVSGGYESRFLPRFLAGDRLLLVVYGDVTAGVDLARLADTGVEVSGRTVRLNLPPSEVFATRVDNERTRVYSRETGLFTAVDPQLETEVRREAERQVRQAALQGGILETAATSAAATLRTFLRGLGFEQIEIRPAPTGQ